MQFETSQKDGVADFELDPMNDFLVFLKEFPTLNPSLPNLDFVVKIILRYFIPLQFDTTMIRDVIR